MRRDEEGAVLIVVVVLVFLVSAFSLVLLGGLQSHGRATETHRSAVESRYAGLGALEEVKAMVLASSYGLDGNVWLRDNALPAGFPVFDDLPVGSALVDVVITDNENGTFTATATAGVASATAQMSFDLRDRDFFSKYMFFTHHDDINIGTSIIRGDVHSNRAVNFYYGGAHMFGEVTACNGIGYRYGAAEANTQFYASVDGGADRIAWPSTNEIATLHNEAEGVYQVSNASSEYSGFGDFDTEVEFDGDKVTITAKKNGSVLKTGTYPLPGNGLIFVQGDVTSLEGDIEGRVTIATMGKVDITGRLRCEDEEGDRAYILTDSDGNTIEDTPEDVVWTEENGYHYVPNPDYDPAAPSVLGIMAANDVTITSAAPYNMEMHAAIFSAQGNWHCDLSTCMGNLKVLGSMVHKTRGWRYSSSGKGWAKSGEYIYDPMLLSFPPPYYLHVDRPRFGGWRLGA